jgi:phage shock protein A
MAHWSQERLATFFEAVSVLMAAKTQSKMPSRPLSGAGADAAVSRAVNETLETVEQRVKKIEETVQGVRRHVATLHESVAEDFKAFEENLATHNAAIQSTKTAMSQTDDLVERVVEAIEVLQTSTTRGADEPGSVAIN